MTESTKRKELINKVKLDKPRYFTVHELGFLRKLGISAYERLYDKEDVK